MKLYLTFFLAFLAGAKLWAADITVTSAANTGAGSLRNAIAAASSGDVIDFDSALAGQTIALTSGELVIPTGKSLTIDGSTLAAGLTIDGGGLSRLFQVDANAALTLHSLTLTGGKAANGSHGADGIDRNGFPPRTGGAGGHGSQGQHGGGILNAGTLTLNRVTMSGNAAGNGGNGGDGGAGSPQGPGGNGAAGGAGGAIYSLATGVVEIVNCTLANNAAGRGGYAGSGFFSMASGGAGGQGGAIANHGLLTIDHTTIVANVAGTGGLTLFPVAAGGGIASSGTLHLTNTIVSQNTGSALAPDLSGTIASQSTNFIGGDPMLDVLADYSGLTETLLPLDGSPIIDAGSGSLADDQRGFPRDASPDIGAVEFLSVLVGQEVLPPANGIYLDPDNRPRQPGISIDGVAPLDAIGYFYWNERTGKLFSVRAVGNATISWKKDATDPTNGDPPNELDLPVSTTWPSVASGLQIHVTRSDDASEERAPTNLQPMGGGYQFQTDLYSENAVGLQTAGNVFNTTGEGYSTLLFTIGEGTTQQDADPILRVVRTYRRTHAEVRSSATVDVGQTIDGTLYGHTDTSANGYVVNVQTSQFDASGPNAAYVEASRSGQLIPANKTPNNETNAVIWYETDAFGIQWPTKATDFTVEWPTDPHDIVLTSFLGSENLDTSGNSQPTYPTDTYSDVSIYVQSDSALPGHNPNEEHALISTGASGAPAAFALRNDLNDLSGASEPYVLVKYRDIASGAWAMRVYTVHLTSLQYGFSQFSGVVGTPVQAPNPISLLGPVCMQNSASGPAAFVDRNGQVWGKRDGEIVAQYFYALQPGFWWERDFDGQNGNESVGDCVPWLDRYTIGDFSSPEGQPINTTYTISWPSGVPQIRLGETLIKAKNGLPNIAAMDSVALLFDEANPDLSNPIAGLASLFDGLSPYATSVTGALLNGSNLEVGATQLPVVGVGNDYEFPDLPYGLKKRLYWNDTSEQLAFRGFLDDPNAADPVLFPNVMTAVERDRIKAIGNGNAHWDAAIDILYAASRNPGGFANANDEVLVGLEQDGANVRYATPLAGKALSVNPSDAASFPRANGSYLTLVENNDASSTNPVSVHVIEVVPTAVTGHVLLLPEENPLVERISLRLSPDFAGKADEMLFEWYIQEASSATSPQAPNAINPIGSNGWLLLDQGMGKNSVTIEGTGVRTLQDNWVIARWKGYDGLGGYTAVYSDFTGDPAATTDPLAVFVPGWIKRVLEGINAFDQRIKDFRNNEATTYVNMISQAGGRYEGDTALNADAVNSVGLIELYETILRRGVKLSIEGTPSQTNGPTNNALLLVASRLSDLYMLLGNEAYSDAQDPTVGIGDGGALTSVASRLFTFGNQVANLLEEELALLRGRDDTSGGVGAAPVYNRLLWNFTSGLEGEPVYVSNYGISDNTGLPDGNSDGTIDEKDARAVYPQGHGDAWGHFLTSIKSYYRLLRHELYDWQRRSETTNVSGIAIEVDYLDERKFAAAAAARAKAGLDVVDLTYRQNYSSNPAEQWQGYKDSDADRAWGVDGWGRRATQGAYLDWLVGNAILPATDPDPDATPLEKIDRTTVLELSEIIENAREIQEKVDIADKGLNPLGLAANAIPFDVDPSRVVSGSPSNRQTHFEQIYSRAVEATTNALTVFNHANDITNRLRQGVLDEADFTSEVVDVEQDYKAQLIEIFGYPHAGNIGPGQLYPTGYDGPDLYYWRYIDTAEVTGATIPGPEVVVEGLFSGFKQGVTLPDGSSDPDDFTELVGHFFEGDVQSPSDITNTVLAADFPLRPEARYPFVKPSGWGNRRAPGELQLALLETVKLDANLRRAVTQQQNLVAEINDEADLLEASFALASTDISFQTGNAVAQGTLNELIAAANSAKIIATAVSKKVFQAGNAAADSLPKVVGTASDVSFAGRLGIHLAKIASSATAKQVATVGEVAGVVLAAQKEAIGLDSSIQISKAQYKFDVQQRLKLIEQLIREEVAVRLSVFEAVQELVAAQARVDQILAQGQRILDARTTYRRGVAGEVQLNRYRDLTFRNFRNDALRKYRSYFDLAGLYTFLAAKVYDFETSLPSTNASSGASFLASIVRERGLGEFIVGVPQPTTTGLSQPLAAMAQSYNVLKTQLGLNNPQEESNRFSLRRELFRIAPDDDSSWADTLANYLVDDVNVHPEFRRYCRPFAAGTQPALVIPFETKIMSGQNFFGFPLGGGDSFYSSSRFSTRIHSVGVWFENYEKTGVTSQPLAATPRIYLVPAGTDIFRVSTGADTFATREFTVLDQVLPQLRTVGGTQLNDQAWVPFNDLVSGQWGDIRRFSDFKAYHDEGFSLSQVNADTRLIGRSVWNTRWLLIIPGVSLLGDADEGLERFINGQESPIGSGNRDGNGIKDIKLFFQTYSHEGL